MHSPLQRNAVAVNPPHLPGVLGCLLAVLMLTAAGLCADLAGAFAPPASVAAGERASACEASASARLVDDTISALVAAAKAERGQDRRDRVAPATIGEGPLAEVAESEEEVVEVPVSSALAWLASVHETRAANRPDPIVELNRVLLAPTRAPPAVTCTVG